MRKFQRKTEDFICQNCGVKIKGTGYTNHCPNCLWSRHVDIFPGDRLSGCNGMMKPIRIQVKSKDYIIRHQCQKCGLEKNNKISDKDSMETAIKLAQTLAEKG